MNRKTIALAVFAVVLVVGSGTADDGTFPDRGASGAGAADTAQPVNLAALMAMAGGPSGPSDDGTALPEFSKVTEGMERMKPQENTMFVLWRYKDEAKAKGKNAEVLYAQIPAAMLGEQFMLSTSISGGGFFTGFPLDERVVRWELLDKQLLLVEPETRYVVDKAKEVGDVVRRTYPDRIRVAVPILTKAPNGDPLIDLGALLKSEFADILWTMFDPFSGVAGAPPGRINPQLSRWNTVKPFELNVEIGVELAVTRMHPPGSYDKKMVHYSFWKLPKTDYQPRAADDRVGYFLTANRDWSRPTSARDIFNRYINRWHLVKRDPALKSCEPKQPIIFYIEKTVPVRFRRAVRDGILEWNKAYEQIGFINAIEVRQQTDDNEWKDLDPEDMRYSFFRWIVTGAGFAMGPSRANPFTGQIYDADIVFDDSMVRFFEQEAQTYLPPAALELKLQDPVARKFLEQHPEWVRPSRAWEQVAFGREAEEQELRRRLERRLHESGKPCCNYMQGMKHQVALAHTVLAGASPEVIDRFLYDVVKEVVMHEVGHTLGLRHNFKASSVYTLEEIQRRRGTGEPTVGSVMDYNPALLFRDKAFDGHFITPTLGPYDLWAIEYGYRPFDGNYKGKAAKGDADKDTNKDKDKGKDADQPNQDQPADTAAAPTETPPPAEGMKLSVQDIPAEIRAQMPPELLKAIESGDMASLMKQARAAGGGGTPVTPPKAAAEVKIPTPPAGEQAMLDEIASRAAEPELAYATDEDTTMLAPDPLTNLFDVGRDPIAWARARAELVDERMKNILEWAVKDKESWYHLRNAYLTLMFEKATVLDYVGRFIGGQYVNRAHRGDPDAKPPIVLAEYDRQRAALKYIADSLFRDEFFALTPEVLNSLVPPRWWHDGASISFQIDFPIHDFVGFLQWWNLFDRLFPPTLQRIHDNELRTKASDKFTLVEYLRAIQEACWADAIDGKRLDGTRWDDARPFLSSIRRSLQREYLGLVEPLVRSRPGAMVSADIQAMLVYALQNLANDLDRVTKTGKADFASQAHLVACKSRIDRMLKAELREREGSLGGSIMLMGNAGRAPSEPVPQR